MEIWYPKDDSFDVEVYGPRFRPIAGARFGEVREFPFWNTTIVSQGDDSCNGDNTITYSSIRNSARYVDHSIARGG